MKTGIALTGDGIECFTFLGVLYELRENGIEVDYYCSSGLSAFIVFLFLNKIILREQDLNANKIKASKLVKTYAKNKHLPESLIVSYFDVVTDKYVMYTDVPMANSDRIAVIKKSGALKILKSSLSKMDQSRRKSKKLKVKNKVFVSFPLKLVGVLKTLSINLDFSQQSHLSIKPPKGKTISEYIDFGQNFAKENMATILNKLYF